MYQYAFLHRTNYLGLSDDCFLDLPGFDCRVE
jgi:hypothetical protein